MGFPSSDAVCSAELVGIDAIAPTPKAPSNGSGGSRGSSAHSILLPPLQCEAFISQRHEVNPALALNLLQDIQATVALWQQQQRQLVQAMQGLYAQGPMVDGWLQSSLLMSTPQPPPVDAGATILRHGDAAALMQYVEALENSADNNPPIVESTAATPTAVDISETAAHELSDAPTQYQLCSLNADGSIHSQHCPPAQMALVGQAIARYQKFKQLMSQKQAIEAKLQQAVDLLSGVRHQLHLD